MFHCSNWESNMDSKRVWKSWPLVTLTLSSTSFTSLIQILFPKRYKTVSCIVKFMVASMFALKLKRVSLIKALFSITHLSNWISTETWVSERFPTLIPCFIVISNGGWVKSPIRLRLISLAVTSFPHFVTISGKTSRISSEILWVLSLIGRNCWYAYFIRELMVF